MKTIEELIQMCEGEHGQRFKVLKNRRNLKERSTNF